MSRRILKANLDSLAGLEIRPESVKLSGDNNNFFYSDESGCYIVGKVSFLAEPQNIRVGGGYTFPTAYKGTLPSTAVNPQPIFIAKSPVEGFSNFAEEVATLLGELL